MPRTRVAIRSGGLKLLALVIAVVLWVQVHGQGEGSLSMDVPLQVQGLPDNMVIVNDLPDRVRITVSGLQTRLAALNPSDIHVPLDASDLKEPGVVERALEVSSIRLPPGLVVEKVQPDRVQLQVDRVVKRVVPVRPKLELDAGWKAVNVSVTPPSATLTGPEVWLDALTDVPTTVVHPKAQAGPFEASVGAVTPVGKAIRLADPDARFTVRGVLIPPLEMQAGPAGQSGKPDQAKPAGKTEQPPQPGRNEQTGQAKPKGKEGH